MKQKWLTDYRVTPSVVVAGEPATVTITPRGSHAAFAEGETHTVEIWPHETTTNEIDTCLIERIAVVPQNGALVFEYTFPAEQGYTLKLRIPEEATYCTNAHYNPPYRANRHKRPGYLCAPFVYMYAVNPDWKGMTVHKGDLHLHTEHSDGHESVGGMLANLRAAGCDFAAITDHYVYEPSQEAAAFMGELPDVMTALAGEEVHIPTEFIHAVAIGGCKSVNSTYYDDPVAAEAEIAAIGERLDIPAGIDRRNCAARVWLARKAKEYGAMPILTHPFWLWNQVYFMPLALTEYLFRSGEYEAYEMLNEGGGHEGDQLATAFYYDQQRQGYTLPVVGNSDSHCSDSDDYRRPALAYTLILSKGRCWESLHQAVLDRRSVAVETYADNTRFHLFGDFRMVKYMNFLLRHYYPLYMELCHAQGVVMKQYDDTRDAALLPLLAQLKQQTDDFTAAFFGW